MIELPFPPYLHRQEEGGRLQEPILSASDGVYRTWLKLLNNRHHIATSGLVLTLT